MFLSEFGCPHKRVDVSTAQFAYDSTKVRMVPSRFKCSLDICHFFSKAVRIYLPERP